MTKQPTINVPDDLRGRAWYQEDSAYAFLVHAPITLGHSQLVVLANRDSHEEDAFSLAARHIAKCIRRFRSTLINLDLAEWRALAEYTITEGLYVKTLVLKASAKEEPREYKVHLVPCFSPHIEAASDLFRARFRKSDVGGLLHWVGQREHLIDYDTLKSDAAAEERIASFRLTGLAEILRNPTRR